MSGTAGGLSSPFHTQVQLSAAPLCINGLLPIQKKQMLLAVLQQQQKQQQQVLAARARAVAAAMPGLVQLAGNITPAAAGPLFPDNVPSLNGSNTMASLLLQQQQQQAATAAAMATATVVVPGAVGMSASRANSADLQYVPFYSPSSSFSGSSGSVGAGLQNPSLMSLLSPAGSNVNSLNSQQQMMSSTALDILSSSSCIDSMTVLGSAAAAASALCNDSLIDGAALRNCCHSKHVDVGASIPGSNCGASCEFSRCIGSGQSQVCVPTVLLL